MTGTDIASSQSVQRYLKAVRAELEAVGRGDAADAVVEGLIEQIEEMGRERTLSGDDAFAAAIAQLDPPAAFARSVEHVAETQTQQASPPDAGSHVMGPLALIVMLVATVVSLALSTEKPFDNELAGTVFLFGNAIAFCTGLFARRNLAGRIAAAAAGALLGLLLIIYLFQQLGPR